MLNRITNNNNDIDIKTAGNKTIDTTGSVAKIKSPEDFLMFSIIKAAIKKSMVGENFDTLKSTDGVKQ